MLRIALGSSPGVRPDSARQRLTRSSSPLGAALRVEYEGIVGHGFLLQIDAPAVPDNELKAAARWRIKDMVETGNTVSSSIPLLLEKHILDSEWKRVALSGFGVGLSWGSAIIYRP